MTLIKTLPLAALIALSALRLASCSPTSTAAAQEEHEHDEAEEEHGSEDGDGRGAAEEGHDHAEEEEAEGPRGGRLLEADGLELELTIFESGTAPELRVYATEDGEPLDPSEVQATVTLTRLGGHMDRFTLSPRGDYLVSDREVSEPHSFDVEVTASRDGRSYDWDYESYEGRTVIAQAAAEAAGVETAVAGPAQLSETIDLTGRVALRPEARADVRARYRGAVLEVTKTVGDAVTAGERLARVEASESLQTFEISSPIDGVILERATNVGDVAGDAPLFVIADLSRLQAEFHVFPRDVAQIQAGQPVLVESLDGVAVADAAITSFLPTAEADTQTLLARAVLDNVDGAFRPGMTVRGRVTVGRSDAAVTVERDALQRWRDMDVVFTQLGETYEVRPVLAGARADGLVEILDGLEAGDVYVSENSFLIRADIEKAGAAHSH